MIRQKLLQLGWEVLIHLPYSPDIAPKNLENSLKEKISKPWKIVKGTWTVLCSKRLKFWEDEIMKLPENGRE